MQIDEILIAVPNPKSAILLSMDLMSFSESTSFCDVWLSPPTVRKEHIIDLFRGACAVKGNVQVAGHVKRIDNGAAFNA